MNLSGTTWLLVYAATLLLAVLLNLRLWRLDRRMVRQAVVRKASMPRLEPKGDRLPRVSFLVAAWNEHTMIHRFIDGVLGLAYPDFELILCAGGNDGTYAMAAEHQDEKLVLLEQQPGEGKQHALQRCLEKSTGEILYLTDADCLMSDEVAAWTLAPIINGGEQAVSGCLYIPLPEQMGNPSVVRQCATSLYTALRQPRYSLGLLGGNCAVARPALEAAGAFRNPVRTGTDYDLAKRLLKQHVRIYFEANASIRSEFPDTLAAYYRQQARWMRNVVMHGLQYQAYGEVSASLRTSLLGLGMLLFPFCALGLSFFAGLAQDIALGLMDFWMFAVVYAFLSRLRYLGVAGAFLGFKFPAGHLPELFVSLLVDFVAWVIPLGEYAFKYARERW